MRLAGKKIGIGDDELMRGGHCRLSARKFIDILAGQQSPNRRLTGVESAMRRNP